MSLGYASRLSHRKDLGGQLGAREHRETDSEFTNKIEQFTKLFDSSRRIVVFTGAGISTSCGIPDFRGPNGIWTLQRKGQDPPKLQTSFTFAKPSLTHQALAGLVDCGRIEYVVSQNVDGLHLRSKLPREKLAELHGNTFAEKCPRCRIEYVRDFEMTTVGFRSTGRVCDACGGRLKDQVLDWDDPLPEEELDLAEQLASSADLALCLGTSLQICPARDIPLKTVEAGGKLVIVNLQNTPLDKKAHLNIHEKVDKVMRCLMNNLKLKVPDFVREDRVVVLHRQGVPSKDKEQSLVTVEVVSPHGFKCPIPVIQSITLKLTQDSTAQIIHLTQWPFIHKQRFSRGAVEALVCVELVQEVDVRTVEINYHFHVLDRDCYLISLQDPAPLPPSLAQSNSNKRLPVMQCKECKFRTQVERFE